MAVLAMPAFAQMMDMPMKGQMEDHMMMGAGGKGQMIGMGMGAMEDNIGACLQNSDALGLSDDQVKKLTPLHRDMQRKHARFKAEQKIAELDMMDVMDIKDFDLDKAVLATKKISEIRTAAHIEMLKSMKEVRAILTEEQFQKMKKMFMTGKMRDKMMGDKKPAKKKRK